MWGSSKIDPLRPLGSGLVPKTIRFRELNRGASVLKRGFDPDSDGTYPAEISAKWLSKIPFGKGTRQRQKYQTALREVGLLNLVRRGSKEARRANIYSEVPLDLYGPRPTLPYSPSEMAQIASNLKTEPPLIEYVLVVTQRYSEEEQRERYGKSGVSFFNDWTEKVRTAVGANTQDQRSTLGVPAGSNSGPH